MQIIDFQTINKGGIRIFHRHWSLTNPIAVVCLVHGLGEHVGRYEHVADFFSTNNIATFGFDHQGHGKSGGKLGHALGLVSMMDDIQGLLDKAIEAYPQKPIFLYGHSMGGNLSLNFVLRRKPKIAGLIATAPWIRLPKPPSKLLVGFAKLMKHVLPKLTQPNGLDVNGLSKDLKVVEAYKKDPLVHDRISVLVGAELLEGAQYLDDYQGGSPCPTLLMHGLADPITSAVGTAAFAERNPQKMTWKAWPDLKHEIHNEPQQGEVLTYLVEWIMRNC